MARKPTTLAKRKSQKPKKKSSSRVVFTGDLKRSPGSKPGTSLLEGWIAARQATPNASVGVGLGGRAQVPDPVASGAMTMKSLLQHQARRGTVGVDDVVEAATAGLMVGALEWLTRSAVKSLLAA